MTYDNSNRGALFKNDKKTEDNHPDYRGQIDVDGTEFWLDAWINTSKKTGQKFMSIKIKLKDEKPKARKVASAAPPGGDFDDDDLPF